MEVTDDAGNAWEVEARTLMCIKDGLTCASSETCADCWRNKDTAMSQSQDALEAEVDRLKAEVERLSTDDLEVTQLYIESLHRIHTLTGALRRWKLVGGALAQQFRCSYCDARGHHAEGCALKAAYLETLKLVNGS